MRVPFTILLLAGAAPALAQVGNPVGGPVGGGIGGPIGGAAPSGVSGPVRPPGITLPPVNSVDDEDPVSPGVGINTERGVRFAATLTTEYGSNLLRLGDSVPVGSQVRSRSDVRIRPAVTAQAGLPLGGQQLYLNALVGRDFYVRNSFLNRQRLEGVAGVAYRFGRCGGRVQGDYSQRQTQLEEFADVADSIRRDTGVLLSVGCPGAVGLSPDASVGYNWSSNSLERRKRRDSRTFNAALGVSYQLGPRGSIGLRANYAHIIFPNEPVTRFDTSVVPPRALETFNYALTSYGGGATAQYRIGPSLNLVGSLGYGRIVPRAGVGAPFGSLTYDLTLGYTGPRLSGSISAGRAVTPGRGGEATFFVAERYQIDAGYQLGRSINAYAGAARSTREFRGAPLGTPLARAEATSDRVYLGARTSIGRLFTASAEVNHQRRRVVPAIFNYDSTGVRLSLGASF